MAGNYEVTFSKNGFVETRIAKLLQLFAFLRSFFLNMANLTFL